MPEILLDNIPMEFILFPKEFVGGEEYLLEGQHLTLLMVESEKKATEILRDDTRFVVFVNHSLTPEDRKKDISRVMEKWYKIRAREIIMALANDIKKKLGLNFNSMRIKEQKTRWGSCSNKGNLNFNWKIIMAPPEIIEYIVAHEVCHLVHMNHSNQFWSLVERLIPDYKDRRTWLRKNGMRLSW